MPAKAELGPALAALLADLAHELAGCTAPWWLIGSAAMALHGAPVEVRDIDLLLGGDDARAVLGRRGMSAAPGVPSDLFSSQIFGFWEAPPFRVELFAGFQVRDGEGWRALVPQTRERIPANGAPLFVPPVRELIAWGRLFGRAKDKAREPLLTALLGTG